VAVSPLAARVRLVNGARTVRRRPLRVALVAPLAYRALPAGYHGADELCEVLADALAARGHEVAVFRPGARDGTLAGFDLVHDHTVAGLLRAPARRVPTVATVHGAPVGELGDYLAGTDPSVALVAVTRGQRLLRPDLPWAATVHSGVPRPGQVRRGPGAGPVVWLSRFAPGQGPDLAVLACRAAGLPLVLAGSCDGYPERRYLDRVVLPMLRRGVELVLDPDPRRRRELLWHARCLLLPVRGEEPAGTAALEAMAVGTPVVALAGGGAAEVLRPGVTGLVCPGVDDLPAALGAVTVLDPAACAEHVRRSYTAELMAFRYERVYRRVLAIQRFTAAVAPEPAARLRGGASR
jgi:glycosyltransferase involved in cell wall biosynthesis